MGLHWFLEPKSRALIEDRFLLRLRVYVSALSLSLSLYIYISWIACFDYIPNKVGSSLSLTSKGSVSNQTGQALTSLGFSKLELNRLRRLKSEPNLQTWFSSGLSRATKQVRPLSSLGFSKLEPNRLRKLKSEPNFQTSKSGTGSGLSRADTYPYFVGDFFFSVHHQLLWTPNQGFILPFHLFLLSFKSST